MEPDSVQSDDAIAFKFVDDGDKIVSCPLELAKAFEVIKLQVEDIGTESVIPIPDHSAKNFSLAVDYVEMMKTAEAKMDVSDKKKDDKSFELSDWENQFLEKLESQTQLFQMILLANYLNNASLLDTLCKKTAGMLKGKTPEEIRKQFNIKNDFTPEEEEQVRRENEWCVDRS